MAKEIMNGKEAADYLGYSPATLEVSRSTGVLAGKESPPHVKMGRTVRYLKKDLDAWIGSFEKQTKTQKAAHQ